ncbi:MAG: fumarylacetoacetate hydrolase family protein [Lysobacterales bacterium]|jgi:fumarylpyruvate hydrolase
MSDDLYVFAPGPGPSVPVAGEQLLFPVHRIYCVGQNYQEHAVEMGASGREPPFFFGKPADAVCLDAVLPFPPATENLHHEVELVIALAAGGSDIAPTEALERVYGYAVGVDLTRRDLQAAAKKQGRSWTTAKGFDRSAPISAISPVARCGHPEHAAIRLAVNGDLRQSGNTAQMTWKIPEIIAELSRFFELKAGDLVFTGTPAGVGPLLPGDHVECAIEGVGELAFDFGDKG